MANNLKWCRWCDKRLPVHHVHSVFTPKGYIFMLGCSVISYYLSYYRPGVTARWEDAP